MKHGISRGLRPLNFVEILEQRIAPATFVVTNTADTDSGSLRQAILSANSLAGADTITFAIGTGAKTIQPASALPAITGPVTIDGTSQPGFAGTPIIELDGIAAGSVADGLQVTGGGTTIRGLVIGRFSGHGIELTTSGNNVIQGNFIGTDLTGTIDRGNANSGIDAYNSAGNLIGGTDISARNVISGNDQYGVHLWGASTGTTIQGNFIGRFITFAVIPA